ncbi:GSCFA domain-containing protein [Hymenobacter sediminicola]|uniref:GSCFA domain-containing protein n=1 Tax=Hymenobacter sediminicola TaxID=2761579 RepID=A0A7G7WA64_9BACT|nr:GSCFA domain-containing protein [Hymenobacter sediminicola]QNH63257.1 GSCFA domain-containing protein [Hymenobacter sediminicola]
MFRTELPLVPHPQQLPLSARVLTIGSCFSDSIGSRLASDKVHTLVNPFGTVFNPVLACRLLRAAAGEDMDWQQHLVEARGRWQSYDLHATVGADSPVDLLQQVQQLIRDTGVFLATADVVVLTLGTAWVHRLKETGELVSNCHKVPAEKFDKELLTPDEIINAVAETHAYLRLRNPKLRFVLTVSPVRHVKDTLPLNAVSKSVLRVACHYLSELLPDVSYFPAYELLLDDLRDYRFYAEDMLHPSKVAEDYIWERFARTYFDAGFGRFRKEWETIRLALQHRPLHLASPEHRQFLENTLEKLERLSAQADVRMEILDVRRQIESLPEPKQAEPEVEDNEERIDIGEDAEVYMPAPRRATVVQKPEEVAEEIEEYEEFESISEPAEAESEDVYASAEAETAELLDEVAPAKKKRRSRGGAKRNKKKHAARLAAETAALEAEDAVSLSVPATDTIGPETPVVLPEAPAVVISANSDLPLQTAMERRKRNSRRGGRGRRSADIPSGEQNVLAEPESTHPEPEATDFQQATPSEPQPASADSYPAVPSAGGMTDDSLSPEAGHNRRPERTGRSASEKRAAALRKPHRASSRTKPLYNSDASTPEQADTSALPTPPVAEAVAPAVSSAASAASGTSSIPDTKGTGASGQLSATGKATRADRPARSQTKPATPAATTDVVSVEAASEPVAVTPAKPANKPRRAAATSKAAPLAAAVPALAEATPPLAAPIPPARKSRAKPKADVPGAQTPVVAAAPAKKPRKSAATTSTTAEPAVEKPVAPKRQRPPRRKSAASDPPAENA